MKGNLILTTINLFSITHLEVYYTAILYYVLFYSTIPVGRVTLVAKIGMIANFKAYTRDLGAKLYKAPLSIKMIFLPPLSYLIDTAILPGLLHLILLRHSLA